jgi:transposase
MYMQLTEAEASFRELKSELSIRRLFHQKEERVKAHVPVAFLGLCHHRVLFCRPFHLRAGQVIQQHIDSALK